jgi:hypothetical protein
MSRAREAGQMAAGRIVAHLFDSELAPIARAHGQGDFVITDALASRMLVHASRDRHLAEVYTELFDADGPIVDTVELEPCSVPYGSVVAGLADDQVIPIGVILGGAVTLNPPKSGVIEFRPGDRVAVIRRVGLRDVQVYLERARR